MRTARQPASGRATAPFHLLIKPIGPICNLNCAYCFYLKKQALVYPDETSFKMTDDMLDNLTRQYMECQPEGTPEINFGWQGGEPTLMGMDFFRKAIALQKKYARPGLRVTNGLQTNGVLLDDEWAQFLHDENFLVGLSIDGPEHLHDEFRRDRAGKGTLSRVMQGLEALRRHEVEFNTLTVVQSSNSRHPVEVYDFLKEIGSTFFQFIPIVEQTEAGIGERSVSPIQYGQFLNGVFDRWLEDDVGQVFVQQFDVMLGIVMGQPAALCVHSAMCGRSAAIEHNGDLYSCDHFVDGEHLLGNIAKTSLAAMIDGDQQTRFGEGKNGDLPTVCRECEFLRYCYGACLKDRIATPGDGVTGHNYLCDGYRQFYEHSLPVFERMAMCLRNERPASDYKLLNESGAPPAQDHKPDGSPRRNGPCPCGSGLKYKKCCMLRKGS
jgi:uncharacterized protein